MNIGKFLYVGICILMLLSCGENKEKKNIVFYDTEQSLPNKNGQQSSEAESTDTINTEVSYDQGTSTVSVPFVERGGVKYIDVTVNGEFTVPMILDSGCSTTLISIAEARYLYDKGCIKEDDIIGFAQSQIADGSIVNDMVINLRQIVIGDKIVCDNVRATVSSNAKAPLLLGNEVLDRAPSYSIDNVNHEIIFNLEQQ